VKSAKLAALAALAIFAVAACGGSSATPAGANATTPPASSAAGASAAGATAAGATASPSGPAATSAASVAAPADLCTLLSAADISAATGKKYEAGFLDSVGTCNWNVGKNPGNSGNLIIASVMDQQLSLIKSTFPGGSDATVGGHAAYWNGSQGLGSMWVDIGGKVFILSFPRSSDLGPEDQAIAQKLAELAIAKM
jgi:hypothetical protein